MLGLITASEASVAKASDEGMRLYRSAKQRIRSMVRVAVSASNSLVHKSQYKDRELGDLADAESELHAGTEQFINNLDVIAASDSFRAYNLATGFIFALRGYGRLGGFYTIYETPAKIIADNVKMKQARPKKKNSLDDVTRQARIDALRVALETPLPRPLGKPQGNTALAGRLQPAFNAHLKSLGLKEVSVGVIEKMLPKNPPS